METRVWTINKIAEHFKREDPNTAITESSIRRLVKSGKIPSVMIGNRYLVNVEAVEAYFSNLYAAPVEQIAPTTGTIRPVPERLH